MFVNIHLLYVSVGDVAWDAFPVVKMPRYVTQSSTIFTVAVFSELDASVRFQGLEHIMYSGK